LTIKTVLHVCVQILFALAEALHTHGYTKEACKLARQLADEMLSDTCTSYTPVDHPTHHVKGDLPLKQPFFAL